MATFKQNAFENLHFSNPEFPVIFHFDTQIFNSEFSMHWQESPELLYFVEGEAEVIADGIHKICRAGEITFFNSGQLHSIYAHTSVCRYYCLIVEQDYIERQGIPVSSLSIQGHITDTILNELFDQLVGEMGEKGRFYQTAVKALILSIYTRIARFHLQSRPAITAAQDKRLEMVKIATRYMQEHFTEPLDVDGISAIAGFSKYYFCRGFKEITGRTVVDYLNFLRCTHACRLLKKGRCNVSEAAEQSGFHNLSYFSKIYRQYMGVLPSHEEVEQ